MITQEELKQRLSYDQETGLFVWIKPPRGTKIGSVAGSADNYGYWCIGFNNKSYKAHRLAWFYVHGEFPDGQIDHINQIKSDNRISNLRVTDASKNCQNIRQPRIDNKLKTKGVIRKSGKFYAQIQVAGKKISLGYYSTLEAASIAYQDAKARLHIV